jgi:hypothetical protein
VAIEIFFGGQGAKLENGNIFLKTNFFFWGGNVFVKQQVTKVSNINKFCKFQI